jgi:pSer/pThr/pTyr-binding forkhead associated (FHA) protein
VAAAANGSGAYAGGSRGPEYASMETPDSVRRQSAAAAASEGTLQLLPGRFEVVAGMDGGRDIRFVRGPGGTPEITLGRMDGPTYRHVQLPAQTVSRMHARMRFEGGRWQIANLSPTNPVVVNGEPLDADGPSRVLAEGDRVELGEVVLRFRERA